MFVQIFLSAEADAGAAFAVLVRTHAAGFGAPMLLVDFALVAEETSGVGEAADVVAFGLFADVGAGVLVHVLAAVIVSDPATVGSEVEGLRTSTRTSWKTQAVAVHTPDQRSTGHPAHFELARSMFYCSVLNSSYVPHLVPY